MTEHDSQRSQAAPKSRDPRDSTDLDALAAAYATGRLTPRQVLARTLDDIERRGADGTWITVASRDDLMRAADEVEARRRAGEALPLFGVPFGVKDNIDVAGLPTTAACPAFTYSPSRSATAVERLQRAGAIVVGKTNLDQFATGLVGVRSPYGLPRNPFDDRYVSGGSSSGSALAVALGQVSFALGTDTAGSGRVPAAFNNIVGLKPSRGVISAAGVVPACRSLDCVSVFAATCEDAARVAEVMRGFDEQDPLSRPNGADVAFAPAPIPPRFRFAIPADRGADLHDAPTKRAFDAALDHLRALGGTCVEIDFAPFREAAGLLYAGPFVAERLEAGGRLLAEQPEALLPPIRSILEGATRWTAREALAASTRLSALRRDVARLWRDVDFLAVPAAPALPTIEALTADPLGPNAALGLTCNFVNLLDLAALAVPIGFRPDGLPAGITLAGPWGSDARLAGFGTRLHRASVDKIGATGWSLPPAAHDAPTGTVGDEAPRNRETAGWIDVVVVGAHLSGEPLNHQLTSLGGRFVRACRTAALYRLYELPNTTPAKPGLVHVGAGETGAAIEVEVWRLAPPAFASFVAAVPAPLCIGRIQLDDASSVSGFLCEPRATVGAKDISSFGGWRAFRRVLI